MPKVRIIEIIGLQYYNPDSDYWHVPRDCADWEEISDADYKLLLGWAVDRNRESFDTKYVIACQSDVPAMQAVSEYIANIKARKAALEESRQKSKQRSEARERDKKANV